MVISREQKERETKIKAVYTDPASSGGYAGVEPLYRAVHAAYPSIKHKDVQKFLEANRTYTLFKPVRTHFQRLRTVPSGFMSGIIKFL